MEKYEWDDTDDLNEFDSEEDVIDERPWYKKLWDFIKGNKGTVTTVLVSLGGIMLKDALDRKRTDSTLYTTDETGAVYQVRAQRLHTIRPVKVKEDKRKESGFKEEA